MLEVINSNNKIHYPAFINALNRGWKVSPVCGNDNHGLTGHLEAHLAHVRPRDGENQSPPSSTR